MIELRKGLKLDKYVIEEEELEYVYSKPVSILVPVYNEELSVVDTISSLLCLKYPKLEIIVINDGSTDATEERVIQHFQMEKINKAIRMQLPAKPVLAVYQSTIHPNLQLIIKENGGKADALNVGINVSKYPYFCSIDGDSILDTTSLLRVMKPIVASHDEVIAAGGSIRVANGFDIQMGSVLHPTLSSKPLVIFQAIEYLRAFFMGRIALSKFNLVLIISGAFSVFEKRWVIEAGGYSKKTIGEDMELVVKLHRLMKEKQLQKRIEFVPDPVCWTEAPENLQDLRKQRRRWHQGLLESLWKHKKMTLNPKYGVIGMLSFPYFWLIECLGPVIELGGYLYIFLAFLAGDIYIEWAILLILLLILYSSVLSAAAILLEAWSVNTYPKIADTFKMILFSFTEIFWFRPLTLLWRVEGIFSFLFRRNEWGNIERKGLSAKSART